jgi:hypothetical protein
VLIIRAHRLQFKPVADQALPELDVLDLAPFAPVDLTGARQRALGAVPVDR